MGSEEPITQAEWDLGGTRLAVADGTGALRVWTMKDYVINDWVLTNTFGEMGGEQILCIAWFHNGKKVGDLAVSFCQKLPKMKMMLSHRNTLAVFLLWRLRISVSFVKVVL